MAIAVPLMHNNKGLGVITVRVWDEAAYKTGQKVGLSFERNRLHYFDENEQACR